VRDEALPDKGGYISVASRLMRVVRAHAPLVAVLAVALIVRAGYWVQLHPALLFTDSWTYWDMALRAHLMGVDAGRPSGYPIILKLLAIPGRKMALVTAVQHLAGLALGVVLYILLVRYGVQRWLATLAIALVVLDAYMITSEQFIEAEAFFALLLAVAVLLTVTYPERWWVIAVAGGLLGVAVTIRTAGLFFIPVWLGFVLWTHRPR
jgi:hypothetical protein